MPIFQGQFANVVEWSEYRDDVIFWKWGNKELKKSSRLVIRPGQDAIFLYNGRIEGIFTNEGNYELESQIIPFLSTLKGFKFGFNSGLRAEVVFVNTKEFTVKWGTKNAVLIPTPDLPGGMPIRANGTFNLKAGDYVTLIDKIAGIKTQYTIEDVRERVISSLDGLLMRWISKEGKNMFNLQANALEIGSGICSDLDYELQKIGLIVTGFNIAGLSYPEEVQKRINQAASVGMAGDLDKLQRVAVIDAMGSGGGKSGMGDAMTSAMGVMAGVQMAKDMFQPNQTPAQTQSAAQSAQGAKFCSECGGKLTQGAKFCPECGNKL